ncbi:MAG: hypothetical protein ABI970_24400 [Chloroflexota bacterium]|nr:hypothetical protein [Anaerolineae bacterium]
MGHSIQWDNEEKTVVFQQYTDTPVKDDLYYLAEESAALLKSVLHTVHLIIDERMIKLTLTSADIKFLEKNVPPNQGVVVVLVNKNDLNYKKFVQNFGQKLAPNAFFQTYFATTPEEARKFLQDHFDVHYP